MRKFIELFGWYGLLAVLGAYIMTTYSIIKPTDLIYFILNVTGATGIVVVSLFKKSYQPAVLNVIWAIVAIIAIINYFN